MRAQPVRLSIAVKAELFIALVFISVLGVVTTLNIVRERHMAHSYAQGHALALVEHAARDLAFYDLETDPRAQEYLRDLSHHPDIAYVLVTDRDSLTNGADADGARAPVTGPAEALAQRAIATGAPVSAREASTIHAVHPIVRGGGVVGVARAGVRLDTVYAKPNEAIWRSFWVFLIGLGLALPLMGLAIRRSMRPLDKLIDAARRVAAREFDLTVDVRTGDELEVLAEAFNDMVRHVRGNLGRTRYLAYTDVLTTLPNRAAFLTHARRAIRSSEDLKGAVLLVNLDRFKRLNDTLGEREGDRVLVAAANRLRDVAGMLKREDDGAGDPGPILARLAGDSFALMVCGTQPSALARRVGDAVLDALRAPFDLANQQVTLTASVGIARFPLDAADPERVLRHANFALDAAKADGGNRFRLFEPEMARRVVERVTLENELRRAVRNNEFVVQYQPKVDARSGAIVGAEALVRWIRRGRMVFPGDFIETAEESGLIGEIGDLVLVEACRAARRWKDRGLNAHVAVNVSAIQFERGDFAQSVDRALSAAELDPERLELELTESVAMTDLEHGLGQVEPLRARGVRFSIDDFGTGYSSLSSLTRLPFDTFKIDRSFVHRMDQDASARVVIETILAMARALGYETVAEGVESPTQYAFLRLNGCTYAQGWLIGKPMSESDFVEMLVSDQRPAQVDPGKPTLRRAS